MYFELVNGRTEQTNKDATFRAVINDKNQNQVKKGVPQFVRKYLSRTKLYRTKL